MFELNHLGVGLWGILNFGINCLQIRRIYWRKLCKVIVAGNSSVNLMVKSGGQLQMTL